VLDSLASLMNAYFECNSKSISFSSRWIKENLKKYDNRFIDALYWLACDLTDDTSIPAHKWKAPNAAASEIRKMRNAIEHGWLRVAEQKIDLWDKKNDYAHLVSLQTLEQHTLQILKLVRSAMQYFCLAVSRHEKSKSIPDDLTGKMPINYINDEYMDL
jgi:hypothetical protein